MPININIEYLRRYVYDTTTGSTGNVATTIANDGLTCVFGAYVNGKSYYVRTWVSSYNNTWFFTVVDPNTSNPVANEDIYLRYFVLKLYNSGQS